MRRLTEIISGNNAFSILDVGTGDGQFIKTLSNLFPEARFTGVDPSEEAISDSRQNFQPEKYSFQTMNSENLDFDNNTFDITTLSNALHHLEYPEKSLQEMVRVTRPGGWIVISEIVADGLLPAQQVQKIFHHHRSRIDRLNGIYHRDTYSRKEIRALLLENGLVPHDEFEYLRMEVAEKDPAALESWVRKMEIRQEKAKAFPGHEADLMKSVTEFNRKILIHGFQPPPNLVLVIKNLKT